MTEPTVYRVGAQGFRAVNPKLPLSPRRRRTTQEVTADAVGSVVGLATKGPSRHCNPGHLTTDNVLREGVWDEDPRG